jgi:hypothetical protein
LLGTRTSSPVVSAHVFNLGGEEAHSPLDRLRKELSVESRGIMRVGLNNSQPPCLEWSHMKLPNLRLSVILFILAGAMFFVAAAMGKRVVFCGVGIAFIGIGIAYIIRARK